MAQTPLCLLVVDVLNVIIRTTISPWVLAPVSARLCCALSSVVARTGVVIEAEITYYMTASCQHYSKGCLYITNVSPHKTLPKPKKKTQLDCHGFHQGILVTAA